MTKWLIVSMLLVFSCNTVASGSCHLQVDYGVRFNDYDPFESQADIGVGRLHLRCQDKPASTAYRITLSAGNSGQFQQRYMVNSTQGKRSLLNYNLYTASNHLQIWGDGLGRSAAVIGQVNSSEIKQHSIYGVIPPRQTDVMVGEYQDTITVQVEF